MNKSIFLLAALAVLAGCGSKDSTPPRPSLTGKVLLDDEFGAKQASSTGVLLTTTDLTPQLTTETAADGTYSFNLPDGPHLISYTKPTYGTFLLHVITANAQQTAVAPDISLAPISTTVVTLNPNVKQLGQKFVISGTITPLPAPGQPRPHRLYLQQYDGVIIHQPVGVKYDLSLLNNTRSDGTFADTVTARQLEDARMRPNNKVLVWATGDNPTASPYADRDTGNLVYPVAVPELLKYIKFLF